MSLQSKVFITHPHTPSHPRMYQRSLARCGWPPRAYPSAKHLKSDASAPRMSTLPSSSFPPSLCYSHKITRFFFYRKKPIHSFRDTNHTNITNPNPSIFLSQKLQSLFILKICFVPPPTSNIDSRGLIRSEYLP